jgi:hypothetical protein
MLVVLAAPVAPIVLGVLVFELTTNERGEAIVDDVVGPPPDDGRATRGSAAA